MARLTDGKLVQFHVCSSFFATCTDTACQRRLLTRENCHWSMRNPRPTHKIQRIDGQGKNCNLCLESIVQKILLASIKAKSLCKELHGKSVIIQRSSIFTDSFFTRSIFSILKSSIFSRSIFTEHRLLRMMCIHKVEQETCYRCENSKTRVDRDGRTSNEELSVARAPPHSSRSQQRTRTASCTART